MASAYNAFFIGQYEIPRAKALFLLSWWLSLRKRVDRSARKTLDSLIILVGWFIWLERNEKTFNHVQRMTRMLNQKIIEEATAWVFAGFHCLAPFTAAVHPNIVPGNLLVGSQQGANVISS
uniref:Uncharacterized protein n=1 Tax=Setaria viridis TaxID=4556 RepID=A0A4U6VJK1_SETVI|nr:hypothetical protein SEVIR_3G305800v2 [Setaria viridis]